ncbi:MAG: sulfatase-like hydrolase/transferase [Muribaculaceae bacterium]|nr:sulfatase-like hydrolase/transferase [Muribaculaceae bacterium]
MKTAIFKFIATYFLFVILFMLQKPLFMIVYNDLYSSVSMGDYWNVMINGLPLDLSLAGYLSIIPGILLIINQWTQSKVLRVVELTYYMIISLLMAIVFCVDLGLYEYWGMRLDVTPLFYFLSSPASAMASVSTWYIVGGVIGIVAITAIYFMLFKTVLYRIRCKKQKSILSSVILLLITGGLFIPIRGGFTVSTMNLSVVYYSQNQLLNHAAINPMFSFMYSATHQNNFSSQFRFYDAETADKIFETLIDKPVVDSIPQLFTTQRPNIYLVIMESFSSHLMSSLGGMAPIAVNMNAIAKEGILFTNCFANGYRTDRALPAIISAYPAQPTTSIMKDVTKTDNLPSIPRALKDVGYNMTYYYGGDANFTNMNAFLVSAGFDRIISDKDFPLEDKLSKWGAHDHHVFARCISDIRNYTDEVPKFAIIQTSSSHEPFEVPYSNPKISDKKANAFAYADSCLGDFVTKLKEIGEWEKSLVIIVPDHYGAFPSAKIIKNPVDRHHIPLIFTGGVVKVTMRIETIASQVDIAATLLYQLGIPHDQFVFSKNILNPASPHYAFFVDQSQFSMVNDSGAVVYNCDSKSVKYMSDGCNENNLVLGKVFLQKLYDDLDKR